jgi:tetratricopeptide (TPR) repeat protein
MRAGGSGAVTWSRAWGVSLTIRLLFVLACVGALLVLGGAGAVAAGEPVAVDACSQGRALESLGRYEEASKAYLEGLGRPESKACAEAALARLGREGRVCATAGSLEALGLDSEANAAYRKVLETTPMSPCALAGAKRTAAPPAKPDFWARLKEVTEHLGEALAAVGLGLALLGLLGWILVVIATRLPGVRLLWPFGRLREVRVKTEKLDEGVELGLGEGTTGILRARLRIDNRVDQVSGAASTSDALEGLVDAAPQGALIGAILGLVKAGLPPRDWVVSGQLQGEGDEGRGISLAIERRGAFIDFESFWEQSLAGPGAPSPAEVFRRLTVPAAGWLGHHIAKANNPKDVMSSSARSWALTRCAIYWYDRGDRATARGFYERAEGEDSDNIAALANLGIMDAEEGSFANGARRLERAVELLEAQG